jgi:DNA/RNA endonuclease YhcR with UshA esterase domain
MKPFLAILVIVLIAIKLSADETNSPALLKIGANEAYKYYEKEMTVTGKVVEVTIRPKIAFLNIDHNFPHEPLALVMYSNETNNLANLKALDGKSIEVSGKITRYRNRPQITLESTNQLKVIETKE